MVMSDKLKLMCFFLSIIKAYCENGWTVFQIRGQFGNPTDFFNKSFTEYEDGFGDPEKEYWLGLKTLSELTASGSKMLRITMQAPNGQSGVVFYGTFGVKNADENYKLNVNQIEKTYSTVSDDLVKNRGKPFSTFDKDDDGNPDENCASQHGGGFWSVGFTSPCKYSSLNF